MARSGSFYLVLVVIGMALLASRLSTPVAPPQMSPIQVVTVAPPVQPSPTLASGDAIVLPRAKDGHFYADAQVNGAPVHFLVDTGATGIVLTTADAQRLGLGSGEFSAKGVGAGGTVRLRPVVLARLALGTMAADNVPAMIAEDGLPVSLLGQSFLERFGEVRMAGDQLTLH